MMAVSLLQWFNGTSRVICSQGSISQLFQWFYDVFTQFLQLEKTHYRRTDRPTDGPTDRPSYRDAWTHLKMIRGPICQSRKYEVSVTVILVLLSKISDFSLNTRWILSCCGFLGNDQHISIPPIQNFIDFKDSILIQKIDKNIQCATAADHSCSD